MLFYYKFNLSIVLVDVVIWIGWMLNKWIGIKDL